MRYRFTSDKQGYYVEVRADFLGDDLLVTCTGGDKPHIGAVAVAHPQPSRHDPDRMSATANIICLSGHREDEMARSAALKLSKALGNAVTVVAGMHWKYIERRGIEQVVNNVEALIEQLLQQLLSERDAIG